MRAHKFIAELYQDNELENRTSETRRGMTSRPDTRGNGAADHARDTGGCKHAAMDACPQLPAPGARFRTEPAVGAGIALDRRPEVVLRRRLRRTVQRVVPRLARDVVVEHVR